MPPTSRTKARRVLVVDDHVDSAEMLALLLRHYGHDVREALDPAQALDLVSSFLPHVAFVDLVLPSMSGLELGRRIHELRPSTYLIALTGRGGPEIVQQCASAGFALHLLKPITDHDAVRDLLQRIPATD
jgi:CheY-like chemotaxis protein